MSSWLHFVRGRITSREEVRIYGEGECPARRHLQEHPPPVQSADRAGQKRVPRDGPIGEIEIPDVVAFEVEPRAVAVRVYLDLEGQCPAWSSRDRRRPAVDRCRPRVRLSRSPGPP